MADLSTQTPLRVHLHHGDCLEVMPTLAAGNVAMVFADLPYNSTSNPWDKCINPTSLWHNFTKQVLPAGKIILTANWRFAQDVCKDASWPFRYELIWNKTRGSQFAYANKRPLCSHEFILVFAKQQGIYNPQKTTGHLARKRNIWSKKATTNGGPVPYGNPTPTTRFPLTIFNAKRDDPRLQTFAGHPTQKPVALLEWLIKTYTNAGDTVLDPVSGSATTAIAAIRNGRNVVCIEKDATYFAIGVERVKAEIAASGVAVDLVIHE